MTSSLPSFSGIVPELKHPDVVNERIGKPHYMENRALLILKKYGYPIKNGDGGKCETKEGHPVPCGPVIIQCFHKNSLKYLSTKTDTELMMLIEHDPSLLTRAALDELATFIRYYTVWKETLVSGVEAVLNYNNITYNGTEIEAAGGFIPKEDFPGLVHGKGMELGIYTIYDSREPSHRGCEIQCEKPENKTEELFYYFRLGVDAIFVENIKEALELELQYDYDQRLIPASDSSSPWHSKSLWVFLASIIGVGVCSHYK